MLAALLCTGESPVLILTQYDSLDDPRLLELLEKKGILKFVAFAIPVELVQQRYGQHYMKAIQNEHESDELRVIDSMGSRAFYLFSFSEMGPPFMYESPKVREEAVV